MDVQYSLKVYKNCVVPIDAGTAAVKDKQYYIFILSVFATDRL